MTPARIEQFLSSCGTLWLGGQKELVRNAISQAVREEAHTVLKPARCTCDICRRVHDEILVERLA